MEIRVNEQFLNVTFLNCYLELQEMMFFLKYSKDEMKF